MSLPPPSLKVPEVKLPVRETVCYLPVIQRTEERRLSIRNCVDTRGADQGGAACTGGGRVSQGFREKKVSAE